ncbi:hypothetical protein C8R46DRAFT_1036177 [Mycena filopes]|nr:hypothetical protein C8R46DRAFT_1036177 [Mycena filopes]
MLGLRAADSFPASTSNFASLVFPAADSATEPTSGKGHVSKSMIEWLFIIIAVLLIACLFLRRMLGTRRSTTRAGYAEHPHVEQIILADPFCFLYSVPAVYIPCPVPAHAPSGSARVRGDVTRARTLMRIQAADIGPGGRRANGDAELELELGDMLPAYDGAPRYAVTAPGSSVDAVEGEVGAEPGRG